MDSYFFYITSILIGFALLIWSSDRFVDGAADLAAYYGVNPMIVGMVVIGFGTSAPEMLVSAVAAFKGSAGIGIGNALGSNITNISLVLGVTAIIYIIPVKSRIIRKELPLLLACNVLALGTLAFGTFDVIDGIVLFTGLVIVLTWMMRAANTEEKPEALLHDIEEHFSEKPHQKTALFWTIVGLLLLLLSSNLLVWGSSNIAQSLGVSDLVIGLTIVAIGTSLPELAATLMSAKKGETDLAIGNIIGSNFFNTLGVLALPALLAPQTPDSSAIYRDMPIVIVLTFILLIFAHSFSHKKVLNRWKGIVLVSIFIGYQGLLFYHSANNVSCHSLLCL